MTAEPLRRGSEEHRRYGAQVDDGVRRYLTWRLLPFMVLPTMLIPTFIYFSVLGETTLPLWGIPFFVAALVLFVRGWRHRVPDGDDVEATAAAARRGRWYPVAAWACTVIGLAGPFWVHGAIYG